MKILTQNVMNMLGEKGKAWLASLPNTIEILADHWKLSNLVPVNNMTYNYVTKATHNASHPVVLKIGFDTKAIANEKLALIYFDGNASIRLIDYSEKYNALLLQQAIPGETLKSFYPDKDKFVIDCYVATVKKLLDKPLPDKHGFSHIGDFLKAIDTATPGQLPEHLLKKAIYLKNELLASMKTNVFLHGDLHHDNILKNGDQWLTIDPKGVVGEPEYEIAAFDFIHDSELVNDAEVKKLFETRIKLVAEKANLSADRLKDWVFVRLILMAVWSIEDNDDPSRAIKLAEVLYG